MLILSLPGKILEQIVHSNISAYLELNELLNDNQSGFWKGYSTVSTVAHFTDDIFLAMNENQSTLAVYIDLRKAFDTVNHTILIKKIEKLGLNVSTVKWLTSYLTNRRQCTKQGVFKGTPSIPETYLSSSVARGLNLRVG